MIPKHTLEFVVQIDAHISEVQIRDILLYYVEFFDLFCMVPIEVNECTDI